jgi:hypothetical protein
MILATVIFTLYIAYYWKSGVKSISMSAYENGNWSRAGFALFMIAIGVIFAHQEGKEILGFGMYQIAGGFLCFAGLSFNHQTPVIKQIHHVASTIAILFGFIALWNLYAVGIFVVLSLIAYFVQPWRFLWNLEIIAFYTIIAFKI